MQGDNDPPAEEEHLKYKIKNWAISSGNQCSWVGEVPGHNRALIFIPFLPLVAVSFNYKLSQDRIL